MPIQITRRVTDMSTKGLFIKFFTRMFIIFVALSILFVIAINKYADIYFQHQIENVINQTALGVMEAQTNTLPLSQKTTQTNYILSKAHEDLNQNKAIKDSALILYDLTNRKGISSSSPIAIYNNNDLLEWYQKQYEGSIIIETILPDTLIEFYDTHHNVYIKKLSFLNGTIVPEEVGVKANDSTVYTELARADEHRNIFKDSVDFRIIGNRLTDESYTILSSYAMRVDKETKDIQLFYDNLSDKYTISSKEFTINDIKYRLDVVYNYNFMSAVYIYIIAIELFLLILCLGISFFKVKEYQNHFG